MPDDEGVGIGQIGQQIERLTNDAKRVKYTTAPGEPPEVYFEVGPMGNATRCEAAPAHHNEFLATPAELVKFATAKKDKLTNPAFFYTDELVVLVSDLDVRRDYAYTILTKSPQYLLLATISGKEMPQREIVRQLRIGFRGAVADTLVARLRELKFARTNDGGSNLQHGSESMGKAITAQVLGADSLPDTIALSIPIINEVNQRQSLAAALEVDVSTEQFRITAFPNELREAVEAVLTRLRSDLEFDGGPGIPVFRGLPFPTFKP